MGFLRWEEAWAVLDDLRTRVCRSWDAGAPSKRKEKYPVSRPWADQTATAQDLQDRSPDADDISSLGISRSGRATGGADHGAI
jgi:hypothetical protein